MFIASPTEWTTAVTDLILALQCVLAIVVIRRSRIVRPMWTPVWIWIFALLCLASFLGAVSHGLEMAKSVKTAIWIPTYLALGLMMALFVVAAVSMMWNHELAWKCLPFGIVVALAFFTVTQLWSDSFLLFVVYEGFTMFLALCLYIACFLMRRESGSGYLAVGIVVSILAALIDTQKSLHVVLGGWEFNNHGVFHLVQMISLALLTLGLHHSHQPVSAERRPNL